MGEPIRTRVARAVSAALAAALALSLAPLASGETPTSRPAAHAPKRAPHKKPAPTKKKKTPRRVTVAGARPGPASRLAFIAPANPESGEPLVDEAQLPPVRSGACPAGMAAIDHRFCVDRWEASLVEIGERGEHAFPFNATVDDHVVRAVSVAGVMPQGYVSGAEAAVACGRSGKRLCSRMEWRKACVGPQTRQFGYADTREHGRCNDAGRSPMRVIWGPEVLASPEGWDPVRMNDARLNALPGSLAPTGTHEGCTNEYGVFDMVGNLHEWTSDPDGTFQGGYYLDTTINGDGCAYRTTAHDFGYHDYSTGFRCCADPE
jgi:hypothetical protein